MDAALSELGQLLWDALHGETHKLDGIVATLLKVNKIKKVLQFIYFKGPEGRHYLAVVRGDGHSGRVPMQNVTVELYRVLEGKTVQMERVMLEGSEDGVFHVEETSFPIFIEINVVQGWLDISRGNPDERRTTHAQRADGVGNAPVVFRFKE